VTATSWCPTGRTIARAVLGLMGLIGLSSTPSDPASASAAAAPGIQLSAERVPPGREISVILRDWPAAAVLLEVCQTGSPTGSVERCAYGSSASVTTTPGRPASSPLRIEVPGGGCPCEVRATALSGAAIAVHPVEIEGAPRSVVADPAPTKAVVIERSRIVGARRLAEWFGAPVRRTLVLTIRNRSDQPLADIDVSVAAGEADRTLRAFDVPRIPTIPPGETASVRVPVELPVDVGGSYRTEAEASAQSLASTSAARFSTHPWGIVAVLTGVVLALGFRLRRLRRRQRAAAQPSEPGREPVLEEVR
jgi:hypothetical protein